MLFQETETDILHYDEGVCVGWEWGGMDRVGWGVEVVGKKGNPRSTHDAPARRDPALLYQFQGGK